LGYQKSVCLTNTYCTACETYQTVAPLTLPPKALGTLPAPQQKKKRSRVAIYAAVPAVIIAGFFLVRFVLPKEPQVEAIQTAVVLSSPAKPSEQEGQEASVILDEDEAEIPVTGLRVTTPSSQPGLAMETIVISGDETLVDFQLNNLPGWDATPVRIDPAGALAETNGTPQSGLANIVLTDGFEPQYLELP
jgi:hypothetical protein